MAAPESPAGHRLAVPVAVAVVGLVLIGFGQSVPNRHSIEKKLTHNSAEALQSAGITGVTASFTGRDAKLSGAAQPGPMQHAETVVAAVEGVRVVKAADTDTSGSTTGTTSASDGAPSATASPPMATANATPTPTPSSSESASTASGTGHPIGFTLAKGTLTISGVASSPADSTAIEDAAKAAGHGWKVVNQLSVDTALPTSPPPAASRLPALTKLLATAPIKGSKLVIQYRGDQVILRGTPATPKAEFALLDAARPTVSKKVDVLDGLDVPGH